MQSATNYIPHQLKGYFRSLMEYIVALVDFILHIDKHLIDLVANYHHWVYLILFLIIFICFETYRNIWAYLFQIGLLLFMLILNFHLKKI